MIDWLREHPEVWFWLGALSLGTLVISALLVPFVVVRLPEDYFERRDRRGPVRHPAARIVVLVVKNVLGVLLIAAGIFMLVLPGQGILTIAIGLLLINFPGKYKLERRLCGRGPVLKAFNWMRRRAGRPPLRIDSETCT
jgi:hypothetical protein